MRENLSGKKVGEYIRQKGGRILRQKRVRIHQAEVRGNPSDRSEGESIRQK